MLGPHVRQQLVLPGKGARTGRAAPRLSTGVRQLMTTQSFHGLEKFATGRARDVGPRKVHLRMLK